MGDLIDSIIDTWAIVLAEADGKPGAKKDYLKYAEKLFEKSKHNILRCRQLFNIIKTLYETPCCHTDGLRSFKDWIEFVLYGKFECAASFECLDGDGYNGR